MVGNMPAETELIKNLIEEFPSDHQSKLNVG